jgi:hypothetical protein
MDRPTLTALVGAAEGAQVDVAHVELSAERIDQRQHQVDIQPRMLGSFSTAAVSYRPEVVP